jgi:hypothetical protein
MRIKNNEFYKQFLKVWENAESEIYRKPAEAEKWLK